MSRRSFARTVADGIGLVLLIALSIAAIRHFSPADPLGAPQVIDGDSLRDGKIEYRLHGIDAPEYRQTCLDMNGKSYDCGKEAARHLRDLIAGQTVDCQAVDADRYGRTVAVCTSAGRDLNAAMVEDGWAVALPRHTPIYLPAETRARQARRGIWQGWFDEPASWREQRRSSLAAGSAASTVAPD